MGLNFAGSERTWYSNSMVTLVVLAFLQYPLFGILNVSINNFYEVYLQDHVLPLILIAEHSLTHKAFLEKWQTEQLFQLLYTNQFLQTQSCVSQVNLTFQKLYKLLVRKFRYIVRPCGMGWRRRFFGSLIFQRISDPSIVFAHLRSNEPTVIMVE